MNKPPPALARLSVALVLAAAVLPVQAQLPPDWRPQLRPLPEEQPRGPEDPFVIDLPAPYDPDEGYLALELDNVDVTKRVRAVDDSYTVFRFTPYTPLSRGRHVLRMVEYRADGEIVERGRWAFSIETVDAGTEYALGLGLSHRLDQEDTAEDVDETQLQGGATLAAHHDDGRRRYQADVQLTVDSAAADRDPDARAVDLARFLASRESAATRVAAGHETAGAAQGFDQGNLIFDGNSRRGVSGTLKLGTWDTALTGFVQRTEPLTGFEHGLGISDEDNRIAGAFARVQPAADTAIGAGFVSGEGRIAGAGTVGDTTPLDGSAANVVLDQAWLGGALSARAELAVSELDLGPGFDELSDEAVAAQLQYRPTAAPGWEFGAGYVEIGPEFRSIARLGGSADIEELRLNARRTPATGSLSFGLEASRGEDNVDDLALPTTRKENVTGDLRWEPRVAPDFGGPLFGRPVVTVLAYDETTETIDLPAGSASLRVDTEIRGVGVAAGFDHPLGGRWSATWERRRFDDREDVFADEESDFIELSANMGLLGGDLNLTPALAHDVLENRDSGVERRDTEWRLSHDWSFSRRGSWNLDWTLNHLRTSDDTTDTWTRTVDTRVDWERRPFGWWISASWTSIEEDGTAVIDGGETESYQVFVGVRVDLSGSWP